ncbi:hypothetical protein GCM10009616_06620 [Microlunatus lacustris]
MNDLAELGHTVFVTVHALAATVALVSGVVTAHTGRGFGLHQLGVVVMAATLGPSLAFGWPGFSPAARVTFLGLAALAVFMVVQSVRARRVRGREVLAAGRRVGPEFVRVLGFNLVALTVAGTVVPVLRVEGGVVGIVVAVAVTVVLGHVLVERRVRAAAAAPRGPSPSLDPRPADQQISRGAARRA